MAIFNQAAMESSTSKPLPCESWFTHCYYGVVTSTILGFNLCYYAIVAGKGMRREEERIVSVVRMGNRSYA